MKIKKVLVSMGSESEERFLFVNEEGNQFHGPLFWNHKDEVEIGTRVRRIREVYEIEGSDTKEKIINLICKYKELCGIHDVKFYNSTPSTMLHWQFINGFSKVLFSIDELKELGDLINKG